MPILAPRPSAPPTQPDAGSPDRARGIADSIRALLDMLPPHERSRIVAELAEHERHLPQAKSEQVFGTIIRLFPRDTTWTMDELKARIKEQGIEAKPKEVYNAVGYLAKRGHIRRVGYGRYIVDGIEVVTADDLGGAPSRHEDGYKI